MSSNNGPPSFPTYGTNDDSGYNAQGDNSNPPSYDVMGREGNSSSELHNVGANSGLGPNAPSFTELLERGQMNSEANGVILNAGVQGPSLGAMARGNYSNPSGGVEHSGGVPAPNLSAANRREASGDSAMGNQGSDAQVNPGMSLVGKNFRSFYPNAYYKEKDGI